MNMIPAWDGWKFELPRFSDTCWRGNAWKQCCPIPSRLSGVKCLQCSRVFAICDPSLITKYYHDHPRARNIVPHASSTADPDSSDIPVIAAFSPCFRQSPSISSGPTDDPNSFSDQTVIPMLQRSRFLSSAHILRLALLLLMTTHPGAVRFSQFDPTGKPLTFYPDSLMLSSNPQVLAFYKDTTLVTVHVDLHPMRLGAVLVLNNTCSLQQKRFYNQLLLSIRSIQRVIRHFSSL